MATAPEITHDEIRDRIAKGWTPPADALEPYRHLLRPFYDAKGWSTLPCEKLDKTDIENIAALIAVFGHFGIAVPAAERKTEEAPWVPVLRAYVAEHDSFRTEDAVAAIGWLNNHGNCRIIHSTLEGMGLTSTHMAHDNAIHWTKRRAA